MVDPARASTYGWSTASAGGGRVTRPPEDGQAHVVVRDGPLTPQLLQAVANGRTFGQITIAIGHVLVLRDVLLAHARVHGGLRDGPASVFLTPAYRRAEIRHRSGGWSPRIRPW
jgi:hypothetical protein